MYTVLGHSTCSGCKQAILLLAQKGHSFDYRDAREEENQELVNEMRASGFTTVPQIWLKGSLIGGLNDLHAHLNEKELV